MYISTDGTLIKRRQVSLYSLCGCEVRITVPLRYFLLFLYIGINRVKSPVHFQVDHMFLYQLNYGKVVIYAALNP